MITKENKKRYYIATYNGEQYRIFAETRTKAYGNLAHELGTTVRKLYGNVNIFVEKKKDREYVIYDMFEQKEIFKGSLIEVGEFFGIEKEDIYAKLSHKIYRLKNFDDYLIKKRYLAYSVLDKDKRKMIRKKLKSKKIQKRIDDYKVANETV